MKRLFLDYFFKDERFYTEKYSDCVDIKRSVAGVSGRITIILAMFILSTLYIALVNAAEKKDNQDVFQLSLEELGNIVVTPSKSPQFTSDITQKVDIIDSLELLTYVSGNSNLCEAIARLPGVSVCALSRNDANWGTYGGIGPKYSTYMLQGLPIDAFMDPLSLDLNAIDHIEVQRGAASVFYPNYLSQDFAGNQCPLAGTVNLILKQKIEHPQTVFQISYGSYNTLNGQLFQQNRIGRWNYFCGSTYEISDYTNYSAGGSWLDMKNNPEYRKTKVYGGLTLFMDKSEKQKLTIFGQRTWHDGDAGRIYRGFDNKYGTVNVGYDITVSENISLQSHIGIRSYDRTWENSKTGSMPADIDTLIDKNGVGQVIVPADISLSLCHGYSGCFSVGADYQDVRYNTWIDSLTGYRSYRNKSSAVQGGFYCQEKYSFFKKLILRADLRYGYIKNVINAADGSVPIDNSVKWSNVLWSAGARYLFTDDVSVYLNGGSSFLTPGLKSSGGTIKSGDRGLPGRDGQLPNADLKPEQGIGSDAGIDFKLRAHFKVSVRGFYISVNDAIIDNVVSRNPSQTQSVNAGYSRSAGGELEVSQKVNKSVSWFLNGTGMMTKVENEVAENEDNVEIPFSPEVTANLGVNYYASFGFTLTSSVNYNGGFYDGTTKTERSFFKPGFVLNAYIAQVLIKGESFSVECFARFYNITNNRFVMPWQFQNTGFSGMGGIKVTF